MENSSKRDSLDKAPVGPPEMQVRKSLSDMVDNRESAQGGSIPGMGGPNAIGTRAMAVEQALGSLAQVMPDPAPITDIIARLRAAVGAVLTQQQPGQAQPGLAGIVAPPTPISPPAMSGAGMPAPPPM